VQKPWILHYDQEVPKEIKIPKNVTILDFFDDSVRNFPQRPAIIYFGKKISYADLKEQVNKLAFVLNNMGIHERDRIAIHLPNIPQFITSYLAILKIGAIAVPINPLYTGGELAHILQDSGAKIIITLSKFMNEVKEASRDASVERILITNPKEHLPFITKLLFACWKDYREGHQVWKTRKKVSWLEDLLQNVPRAVQVPNFIPRGKLALLQYTGGTTGRPKGVKLAHKNLVANMLQARSWLPNFNDGEEIAACVLPFFHIYALSTVLNTSLATAATLVLFPQPEIKALVKSICKHKVTMLPGVPLLYERLLELDHENLKEELRSIKYATSGAALLAQNIVKRFRKEVGLTILEGYGLTEASSATHINPVEGIRKPGSVGLPLPNTDVRVVDLESGSVLDPNEVGEIIISGPQIMQGYWNDPQATNQVLKDGWLYTGDVGYMDEDGYLFLVDRKKDMIEIKGSGLKVYPSEVEDFIHTIQTVKEVVVVGKEIDGGGEVPVAYVVLAGTVEPSKETKLAIINACKKDLAPYKVPRTIEFVDEIPKTIIGKPLRKEFKKAPS